MTPDSPEVLSAMTDDGSRLPVIDLTNPAFAVTITDTELAAMCDRFILESRQRQEIPAPLREALQRSRLGRAVMAASGTCGDESHALVADGPPQLATTSRRGPVRAAFYGFTFESHMENPSACSATGPANFAPALRNNSAHSSGSNFSARNMGMKSLYPNFDGGP